MTPETQFASIEQYLTRDNIVETAVGLRPYREGTVRMEIERRGDTLWAHNYGHGGSGITVCWGAARWVVDRLCEQLPSGSQVAVLGAGVIGLCSATLLMEAGHQVTVLARDFPPHTTSNVAGGLWAPTHMACQDKEMYRFMLEHSFRKFQKQEGSEFGVYRVNLYEENQTLSPLDPMPTWLLGEGDERKNLPFGSHAPGGTIWNTYLIETGLFLNRLHKELAEGGAVFQRRDFQGEKTVHKLPQEAVVNCLGLGAGSLLGDAAVKPIRGQLLYLKPYPHKFVLGHQHGYVISRDDRLILGGTFEVGNNELKPNPKISDTILRNNQEFAW